MKKSAWNLIALPFLLIACSTSNGGTVLPSPSGDMAFNKACQEAQPDIVPATALTTNSLWMAGGRGASLESLEILLLGFGQVSFDVNADDLELARGLTEDDDRFEQMPLSAKLGRLSVSVAERGDSRCAAFESLVADEIKRNKQINPDHKSGDPMGHWTDTRFPDAQGQGRNWCLAVLDSPDTQALQYMRTGNSTREGQSDITAVIDTITDNTGKILARRTLVSMTRPSFTTKGSSVATRCDGKEIDGPEPKFFGPTGIALRPIRPPTLVEKLG